MKTGDIVRANIRSPVTNDMISHRTTNGRDEIVVRSVVARDDTVLNGILYPRAELDRAASSLDKTPAPFGHPVSSDGSFLPALNPEAINGFYFGAFNANPRRDGDRIIADKIIDVARARENENGRRVLDAIDAGDPIHTSTGVYFELREGSDSESCRYVATNVIFDHDAILLDEEGAITPEQGVGMLVNARATDVRGKPVAAVYNSMLDDADDDVDRLGAALIQAMETRERTSRWEQMKAAVIELMGGAKPVPPEKESMMTNNEVKKSDLDSLEAEIRKLTEGIDAAIENSVKPISEKLDDFIVAQNADAEAARKILVEKIVANQILPQHVAEKTPVEVLEMMLKEADDAHAEKAVNLNGRFSGKQKIVPDLPKE